MGDTSISRGNPSASATVVRVPLWLAALVVALLILVMGLSAALVRIRIDQKRAGDRDATVQSLELRTKDTKDPNLLLQLGFEYRKAGLLEEALATNRRVLTLDKRSVAARYHIGSILLEMGERKQAEAAWWDALEIDPSHAMSAKALGEIYVDRRQYKSLLVAIQPAAEAHPELADLQYLLGLGKEKTGDLTGASVAYWEALGRDPGLSEARRGLDRVGGDTP